ncbi:hypothetical protein OF846_001995 [Rhodotorula toruloides]|nr:hypothetical protein OF846_001995 [Rhodotorula toruloides]
MSGPLLHRCAVCGTSTENRCSGCSKAGGPIIFFCSPEHQKLVWHNHKRVCRGRSPSFVAPPLSDEEYQHYRQIAEIRGPLSKPLEERNTLAELFEKEPAHRLAKGDFEHIVEYLRSADNLDDPNKQLWLRRVRAYTSMRSEDPTGDSFPPPSVQGHTVWELVAAFETSVYIHHVELAPLITSLVRFKHHALMLATLLHLRLASSPTDIPDDWILRSFENMVEALNDDVKYQHMSDIHRFSKTTDFLSTPVKRIVDFETDQGFFPGVGILELTCYPK